MRILFLLENTANAPEGGTEISSRHLASLLKKKGVSALEWAPYRTRRSPFWYTSLFVLPLLIFKTLMAARKEHVDLIHVQGKYLVPVGVIAGKILRIPVVVTIRDYVVCCPIGLCLFESIKRHSFISFFFHEIPSFLKIYHREDVLINRLIRILLLIRGWFVSNWIRWWMKRTDGVIAVSAYVASVLEKYSISSLVIYNCFDDSKYRNITKSITPGTAVPRRNIVFVGKDSFGKGSDLFDALSKKEEFSKYRFIKLTTDRWTPYEQVLLAMRDALVTVVPSRWQEPFGRVALESLMMGTPVVATDRGGLSEIVENGKNGILAEPTVSSLARSMHHAIQNNNTLRKSIASSRTTLMRHFSRRPIDQHVRLYRNLLGNIDHTS